MSELKCPKCQKNLQVMCLYSNPPQYETTCYCGFELRYFQRKDSFKQISQEEIDFIHNHREDQND